MKANNFSKGRSIFVPVTFWERPNIVHHVVTNKNKRKQQQQKTFKIKVNIFVFILIHFKFSSAKKHKNRKNIFNAKSALEFSTPDHPIPSFMLSHFDLYRKYNCICVGEISRLQLHIYVYILRFMCRGNLKNWLKS